MAVALGKRKRRSRIEDESERGVHAAGNFQDLFKRHFESWFEPLPEDKLAQNGRHYQSGMDDENDGNSDGWDGFEDEAVEELKVEIVDHGAAAAKDSPAMGEGGQRDSLASSDPAASAVLKSIKAVGPEVVASTAESANVSNDLALQRLLRESHLLRNNSDTTSMEHPHSLTTSGKLRHLATDSHLMSLGAKSSIHTQTSMPMSMRKGVEGKKKAKEDVRRKEARKLSIVLEREGGKERVRGKTREWERRAGLRGIGTPGVGKMKGGTLVLGKGDVTKIQGPRERLNGKKSGMRR